MRDMTAGYIFTKNQQAHANLETNAGTEFDICHKGKKSAIPTVCESLCISKRGREELTQLQNWMMM